jgi:hypothetical protein
MREFSRFGARISALRYQTGTVWQQIFQEAIFMPTHSILDFGFRISDLLTRAGA